MNVTKNNLNPECSSSPAAAWLSVWDDFFLFHCNYIMYSYIKAEPVRRLCWGKSKLRRCCMNPPLRTSWLEDEKLDFPTFAPMKRVLSHSSSQIINFTGEAVSVGRWEQQNNVWGSSFQLWFHANYLQTEPSWSWICTWSLKTCSDMKRCFRSIIQGWSGWRWVGWQGNRLITLYSFQWNCCKAQMMFFN